MSFKKTIVDSEFRAEGVDVADVNGDGKLDVIAGNLWYEAPRWTSHEIIPVQKFDAANGYSNCFQNFALDVNRDGWPDQIVITFPGAKAIWRENPKGQPGHWREHTVWRSAGNESPTLTNLLVPGKQVLVFPFDNSQMAWYEPGKDANAEFLCHAISVPKSPGTDKYAHGLGIGDVNGDGRADVLITKGYWEAPPDPRAGPWKFVPANLGPDSAQMYTYDVNGDGLMDVLSSSAHNIGVWWYEQQKGTNGPEFIQHTIDDSFSQTHGLAMVDINGDGLMDLVTGKRFWAHGPKGDVRPGDPAMLYWFELRRSGGKIEWIRHEIDNDSGVGTQFVITDLNRDKLPDIVIANKKGVFVFEQLSFSK
ncbi:MAG: VCBS repeat-containing protein [Pyrinomonadaceae bacterium]|nr:VCBS repeat-containing protein [Pyrinomonadaceae bacterium]